MSVHNFGTLNWTTVMKILEVQLKRILREQYSYLTCGRSDCNTHRDVCSYLSLNVLKWVVGKGQHVSEITVLFMNEE